MDLLGQYSSSESSSEEEEPEPEVMPEPVKKKKVWLPPPDLSTASMRADEEKDVIYRSKDSVFVSKYDREEESVKKVLEQHVSLTDTHVNKFEREKDGKKICWNYRKGRCYKGHNCPLYHDGDIANAPKTSMDGPNYRNASRGPSDADIKRMIAADVEENDDGFNKTRKRRHGLTDSLAPVKGAMKKLQEIDQEKNPHRYTAPSLPKNARIQKFPS